MAYSIRVRQEFSAAHQVHGMRSKCEQMHGHNYTVEVEITAQQLRKPGMVADFAQVKKDLRRVAPDHALLNNVLSEPPTSEHLAKFFYDRFCRKYKVRRVIIWENRDCCAEYAPD